ncbi:MAG: HAMP domain-containing sensor histidine kinase [Acidobacteriota bacterium]
MSSSTSANRLPYIIATTWVVLTVSLASWWLLVGLRLTNQLLSVGIATLPARMFLWEGALFIGLLVAGGVAIVIAIRREQVRRRALETFFMSFTHDLKTSLASLQLQAEGLVEDWPETSARAPLDRLLGDAVRLQIQLENSLFVAQPDGRLLRERIDVRRAIERLALDWPDLAVRVSGHEEVVADARAFDAVLRNLLQNAVVHGGAKHVDVSLTARDSLVSVRVTDDGRGVPTTAFARLGTPFERPGKTSGTGVGLFVCGQLVARMNGVLRFPPPSAPPAHGLTVELQLPGVR